MEKFSAFNLPPQPTREGQDLADGVVGVQQEIENVLLSVHDLDVVNAPPVKLQDGMIRYADGVSWDPGFGAGPYVYRNGAWWPLWPWSAEYDVDTVIAHAGDVAHAQGLTGSWVELSAGLTLTADSKNMRLGTSTGRLQIWYEDADLQPKATHLEGTVAFTCAAVLVSNGNYVLATLGLNGVPVGTPIISTVRVVQQTAGSPQTLALSTAGVDLVHGDELSIFVQGTGAGTTFEYVNLAISLKKNVYQWYLDIAEAQVVTGGLGGFG